jgi:hypothetical protein
MFFGDGAVLYGHLEEMQSHINPITDLIEGEKSKKRTINWTEECERPVFLKECAECRIE